MNGSAPFFEFWWNRSEGKVNLRHARAILAAAGNIEAKIARGEGGDPLDRVVGVHTRARRMGKNDRAVLSGGVYGLARNRDTILSLFDHPDAVPPGTLLLTALLDDLTAAATSQDYEDFSELLNRLAHMREDAVALLAAVFSEPIATLGERERETFAALFSVPAFWLDLGPWKTLGEAARELAVGRRPQSPALRVNIARARRKEVLEALHGEGIEARATERSPWGIVLGGRVNLLQNRIVQEGSAELQDEGSQLLALGALDDGISTVLDYCAGAGGKALALAAALPVATIHVHDSDRKRLAASESRIHRSGAENIRFVQDAPPRNCGIVLVDAPCSSTGTLRRNPEIAWRWTERDIRRFAARQAAILEKASDHVRPGGLLIYGTCSLMTVENEGVVEGFLATHPEFALEALSGSAFRDVVGAEGGTARLALDMPRYAGDGFFLSRMRRKQ